MTWTLTSGLKPESERFYRVFAVNAAGAGPSPVVQEQLFASATTGDAQAPSVVLNRPGRGIGLQQGRTDLGCARRQRRRRD